MKRAPQEDRKLMDRLAPVPQAGPLIGFLATTYEMQAEFFETDFLPAVLGLGAWNDRNWTSRIALEKELATAEAASILLDATCYRERPRSLRVEVLPCALEAGRALHAKVALFVHESEVALLVGSANLTEPGYRLNREVACALRASPKKSEMSRLILRALKDMESVLLPWLTAAAREVIRQARERLTEWSATTQETNDAWFTWGGGEIPLWRQFVERWPVGEAVRSITIVSPFWSEDQGDGPLALLLRAMKERGALGQRVQIRLLTEAFPVSSKEYLFRPVLPPSYESVDWKGLGAEAFAEAIDPRVEPEDVGRDDITKLRPLHAKIVLIEGVETSLCCFGSANFTRHGWGFFANPRTANIEAGLLLRKSGKERDALRQLLPKTVGDPVALGRGSSGRIEAPSAKKTEAPWPGFLKEATLAPSSNDKQKLALLLVWDAVQVAGAWSIGLGETMMDHEARLFESASVATGIETAEIPLNDEKLQFLLKHQEILVQWWNWAEGRAVPLNVALEARTELPIAPGNLRPGESMLLAYYQGRITWEDLFPPPDDAQPHSPNGRSETLQAGVDTSKIQSYQVREFVEALRGIEEDLRAVANANEPAMRLALMGPVSPLALARTIVDAVGRGIRTPLAAGFQLVELLALLRRASGFVIEEKRQGTWKRWLGQAADGIGDMLSALRKAHGRQFGQAFQNYADAVLHRREDGGKP